MRARRGKTFVVFTMVLSVAVLLGGVIASKDRLREEWFLRKLDSKDKEERESAIEKLGELRSPRAVPRLVELAKNERLELLESSPVTKALIHIGSPAVRALLEQCEYDPLSKLDFVLRRLGPEAIPGFVGALEHPAKMVRILAASFLGFYGPSGREAVPALLRKLKDSDREVRFYVVSALEQIGPRVEAIPALLEMLQRKDEDKLSRLRAADTLARTGDAAVRILIGLLEGPESDLTARSVAATALGETESKEAVAALADALRDASEEVRLAAAMALGNMGRAAREAVPALLQALKDPEKQVRSSSAIALSAVASRSLEVMQGLREALKDTDTTVRFAVSMALKKLERNSSGTLKTEEK